VADSSFKLNGDVLSNQLCVKFRLSNFGNVHLNLSGWVVLSDHLVQVIADLINSLSASADDGAWSARENGDLDSVGCSLNFDSRNEALANLLLEVFSNVVVRDQSMSIESLWVDPVAVVAADHTKSEANRMNLLTH